MLLVEETGIPEENQRSTVTGFSVIIWVLTLLWLVESCVKWGSCTKLVGSILIGDWYFPLRYDIMLYRVHLAWVCPHMSPYWGWGISSTCTVNSSFVPVVHIISYKTYIINIFCICVLRRIDLSLSSILILDFGIVPTVFCCPFYFIITRIMDPKLPFLRNDAVIQLLSTCE
jgi:hypothetical protein